MKVLVTGGLGYFGSLVVTALSRSGSSVIVLDSMLFNRGEHLKGMARVELVEGDVRDLEKCSRLVSEVDAVVHLAAVVGEPACNIDKDGSVSVNLQATGRLAKLCGKLGARMIFASTSSVYGARPDRLLTEKSKLLPLSLYALSKVAGEEAISSLAHSHLIFRFGTFYGYSPRMRFDLVANRFVAQALTEGKITVFGGEQYRPFVHIEDAARAVVASIASDFDGTLNFGGQNLRIKELAQAIQSETGCELRLIREMQDRRNYAVDSSKGEKLLGVKPRLDIKFAVSEIKAKLEDGTLKQYTDDRYDNEASLKKSLS